MRNDELKRHNKFLENENWWTVPIGCDFKLNFDTDLRSTISSFLLFFSLRSFVCFFSFYFKTIFSREFPNSFPTTFTFTVLPALAPFFYSIFFVNIDLPKWEPRIYFQFIFLSFSHRIKQREREKKKKKTLLRLTHFVK